MDDARLARIETAAYAVLADKGYAGASMLTIAKAAKASNETLYRHFGDKNGLFTALARRNAAALRDQLDAALGAGKDPMTTLERVAPLLLELLTGERAILLNRAAAGDPTGGLGRAIAAGGRDEIAPRITALMQDALDRGLIRAPDAHIATRWFLSLLIEDRQHRRVIGVLPVPPEAELAGLAAQAMEAFRRLTR